MTKKKEEIKRQNKLKKNNKKFNIQNNKEINDKFLNIFSKITQILTILEILFWFYNFFIEAFGINKDSNYIPTENDMAYLFQKPEY